MFHTFDTLTAGRTAVTVRYGLPVNFQAAFLEPKAKGGGEKKLKAVLSSTYAHLDTAGFKDEVFVDKKRAVSVFLSQHSPAESTLPAVPPQFWYGASTD